MDSSKLLCHKGQEAPHNLTLSQIQFIFFFKHSSTEAQRSLLGYNQLTPMLTKNKVYKDLELWHKFSLTSTF